MNFSDLRIRSCPCRVLLFSLIVLVFLWKIFVNPGVRAATTTVRPNADFGTPEWTSTGASHYTEIDEVVTQPTAGTTSDNVSSGTNGQVDEFDMATQSISGDVTQVKVWAYAQNTAASNGDELGVSIYMGGSYQTQQDISLTTSYGWVSATFTGTWTQTDLDNMRIKIIESKAGAQDSVNVATLYADITYTITASKLLVALEGQTVNSVSVTGSGCPTPTGVITIAGTPTAKTAANALNACVYAAASDDTFVDTATNTVSIASTPNDSQGIYPASAALISGKKDFSVTFKTATSYTVDASASGLTTGNSSSVTINPDSTSKLVITTNPSSVTAGQETTQYIVTRRDQYDNDTTSGTQTVNLTSNSTGTYEFRDTSGGGSVSSITIADTASTENFFYYDEGAGSWTISVSYSGLTGDSKALTVNPDSTNKLVITTNPSSVTAGQETTQYIVTRRDQFNNDTSSGTQTVNLSTDSTGTYEFRDTSGGGSVASVTIADSSATEDFYYYDEGAGSWTISVSYSGLTGDSKSLTVSPDSTSKLVITTNPSSVTAGQETTQYIVTRRDQFNNDTSSGTQTVNLSTDSTGTYEFRDTSGGGSVASVTIADSSATEDFYYYDEGAGSWTISVSYSGLTGDSKALTVNPDSTSKLVITTYPTSVNANQETTAYIVTRRDQFNNDTSSGTQTVNLTSNSTGTYQFRDTSGGGSVSSVTITDGNTTEDFYYIDDTDGTWDISVSYTGLTGDSKSLTVSSEKFWLVLPGQSFVNGTGTTGTASVTANQSFAITIYKTDGSDITDTTYTGSHTIDFTSTATNSPNDNVAPTVPSSLALTFSSGSVTTTNAFTLTNAAENPTITGSESGGPSGTSSSITVNTGSTNKLVITTNPSSVTAGQETTQFIVQRRDSVGNPTTSGNQTVNLSSNSSGSGKQFRDSSGGGSVSSITIVDTASTEDFYYYDEKSGDWTISVAATGLTGDSSSLTVNTGSTSKIVLTTYPTSAETNLETTQYIVTRRDQFDNDTTSGSQTVNLSSDSTGTYEFRDSSGGSSVSSVAITAGNSTEDFYYIDDSVGTWTISISGTGITGDSQSLTIVTVAAPSSLSGSALSTTSIRWSWTDNSSVEDGFRIYDSSDNLVSDITSANTTSYDETGLSSGTSYTRYIVSVRGASESSSSGNASATTQSAATPTPTPAPTSAPSTTTTTTAATATPTPTPTPILRKLIVEEPTPSPEPEEEKLIEEEEEEEEEKGLNFFQKAIRSIEQSITYSIRSTGETFVLIGNQTLTIFQNDIKKSTEVIFFITRLVGQVPESIMIDRPTTLWLATGIKYNLGSLPLIERPRIQIAKPQIQIEKPEIQIAKPQIPRLLFAEKVARGAKRVALGLDKFREIVFDTEPIRIYDVNTLLVSESQVIISWKTNHLSTSSINYGSALGVYEFNVYSKEQTREHYLILTNLEPNTTYYYEVISKNADYAVDAFRKFTTSP